MGGRHRCHSGARRGDIFQGRTELRHCLQRGDSGHSDWANRGRERNMGEGGVGWLTIC